MRTAASMTSTPAWFIRSTRHCRNRSHGRRINRPYFRLGPWCSRPPHTRSETGASRPRSPTQEGSRYDARDFHRAGTFLVPERAYLWLWL